MGLRLRCQLNRIIKLCVVDLAIPEHRTTVVVSDSFVALTQSLLHFLNSSLVYGYFPILPSKRHFALDKKIASKIDK